MILVDTNILLDIATDDPVWAEWSIAQLDIASTNGPLVINDVIYAELSVRYERIEALHEFIEIAGLIHTVIPKEALFLAGKVFAQYKQVGGNKTGVLPDFFIGAHAAVADMPILTRDKGRYGTYFPSVELITPDSLQ